MELIINLKYLLYSKLKYFIEKNTVVIKKNNSQGPTNA